MKIAFSHIDQAGLKLLTSGDPPASASQSAGITGASHHTWPEVILDVEEPREGTVRVPRLGGEREGFESRTSQLLTM